MRVGFVAILGRPNVGKSTLLNALLSKKVSIVSRRAQTTRDSICGILNEKGKQIVFVDTPGIFVGEAALDKYMNKAAKEATKDVNATLYLIDVSAESLDRDFAILDSLKLRGPVYIVLNKVDTRRLDHIASCKEKIAEKYPSWPIIEASLIENFGIKDIKEAIEPHLEEGMPFYPDDAITDKDKAYQAKEVIRQELLHFLKQEIPHQSAVKIETLDYENRGYKIEATIIVNKDNHKAIVIGKGGEMIKNMSMSGRDELERMWHSHITHLTIEVDSEPGWREDPRKLIELGYGERN